MSLYQLCLNLQATGWKVRSIDDDCIIAQKGNEFYQLTHSYRGGIVNATFHSPLLGERQFKSWAKVAEHATERTEAV